MSARAMGIGALAVALTAGCVGVLEDGVPPADLVDPDDAPPVTDRDALLPRDPSVVARGPSAAVLAMPSDPPPESGTPLDCSDATGLLLCADFESGAIDESLFEVQETSGGSVSVEEGAAFQGRYAVRLHLPSGEGVRAALRNEALFPIAGNRFFGRAYVRVGPTVPETHSFLVEAGGYLDGALTRYRLDSNGGRLNSRYTHPAIPEHGGWRKMGVDMPRAAWTCIEWEYDGALGEMRYFIDGTLVDDMTVTADEDPPWLPPTFQWLVLGWHTYQAPEAPSTDVFYDAIAIAEERIGCG